MFAPFFITPHRVIPLSLNAPPHQGMAIRRGVLSI